MNYVIYCTICYYEGPNKPAGNETEWNTLASGLGLWC